MKKRALLMVLSLLEGLNRYILPHKSLSFCFESGAISFYERLW